MPRSCHSYPAKGRSDSSSRITTELCHAVKLNKNMEMEQMVACPRCGSDAETVKLYDNSEITTAQCSNENCGHPSAVGLNKAMACKAWNIRAGGRKPTVLETGGVKALASATGSGAGVESGDITVICERCGGQGWYPWFDGLGRETHQEQCEACYGTGRVEKAKPQPNRPS